VAALARPQKWKSGCLGSPSGQRQVKAVSVATVIWVSGGGPSLGGFLGFCGLLARARGMSGLRRDRTSGRRPAVFKRLTGRLAPPGFACLPARPKRWTLPMTALRVTSPSLSAMAAAGRPSCQSFLSRSVRSPVQGMAALQKQKARLERGPKDRAMDGLAGD
jgi:hypothetical protein